MAGELLAMYKVSKKNKAWAMMKLVFDWKTFLSPEILLNEDKISVCVSFCTTEKHILPVSVKILENLDQSGLFFMISKPWKKFGMEIITLLKTVLIELIVETGFYLNS